MTNQPVAFAYSPCSGKVNKAGEQTGRSGSIYRCIGELLFSAFSSVCLLFAFLHGTVSLSNRHVFLKT